MNIVYAYYGLHRLRELKQDILKRNDEQQLKRQQLTAFSDFVSEHGSGITDYDDMLTRKLVERVIVHDERLVVKLKSGVEVVIDL